MRLFFSEKDLFFFPFPSPTIVPPIIHGIHSFARFELFVNRLHFSRWRGEKRLWEAVQSKNWRFFSSRGLSNFYSRKPGLMPLRYSSVYTGYYFPSMTNPRSTKCTVCRCQLSFIQVGKTNLAF